MLNNLYNVDDTGSCFRKEPNTEGRKHLKKARKNTLFNFRTHSGQHSWERLGKANVTAGPIANWAKA
jgi:hypothetical protein